MDADFDEVNDHEPDLSVAGCDESSPAGHPIG